MFFAKIREKRELFRSGFSKASWREIRKVGKLESLRANLPVPPEGIEIPAAGRSITKDMLDFELEELNQSTDWREVLLRHLKLTKPRTNAAKQAEDEFDGWLPRIMAVDGLESEDLPRIHGKLIALGFLKFQLASRGTGVVYQISPAGRQALSGQPAAPSWWRPRFPAKRTTRTPRQKRPIKPLSPAHFAADHFLGG